MGTAGWPDGIRDGLLRWVESGEVPMSLSILVVGAENPRIGDLFREVGRYATVSYMNIGPMPLRRLDLTGELVDSICGTIRSKFGKSDVVVFTWPHLAVLAEKLGEFTRVYYCKDPFECWTCWNREEIRELESRLLENCEMVFAVSRLLVEDFRGRIGGKVFYLPNGVEETFLRAGRLARPANLPEGKPIMGCVGQINATYDWEYIAELAASLPEARLCFIGNISEGDPYWQREIVKHLTGTANILYLDRQPHERIPAYLQHFDIATCFLRAGDYADRRSPLRLYDYLTTEKSVISTPIREANEHLPHIHIAKSAKEAAEVARRIFGGEVSVDVAAQGIYRGADLGESGKAVGRGIDGTLNTQHSTLNIENGLGLGAHFGARGDFWDGGGGDGRAVAVGFEEGFFDGFEDFVGGVAIVDEIVQFEFAAGAAGDALVGDGAGAFGDYGGLGQIVFDVGDAFAVPDFAVDGLDFVERDGRVAGNVDDAVFKAVLAAGVKECPAEDDQSHGGEAAAEDLVEDDVGVGFGLLLGMGDGPVGPTIEAVVDGPGTVAEEEDGHEVAGDAVVAAGLGDDGAARRGFSNESLDFVGHYRNLAYAAAFYAACLIVRNSVH